MPLPGSPLFLPGPGPLPVVGPLFEPAIAPSPPAGSSAYAAAVLSDSPSGYWRLGELSGTVAADSSGGGNPGTYDTGATLGTTGALVGDTDTAITLDGAADGRVTTAFNPFSGSITLEGWFYRNSTTPFDAFLGGLGANRPALYANAGGTTVTFEASSGVAAGNFISAIPTAAWFHLALTFIPGTHIELFVNGVSVGSGGTAGTFGAAPGNFVIGALSGANFAGLADEVAVYPSVLSSARILAHYNAGIGSGGGGTLALTADTGTATATGDTAGLAFAYTAASGTATTAGTVSLAQTLTATAGTATASGTPLAVTVTLAAASGAATAGGGTVSYFATVNLSATGGTATATGGTDALTLVYTSSSGTATTAGGSSTLSLTYAAATGTASASGGTVNKTFAYTPASGGATATGTLPVVGFTYGASSGTASAGGGDATATAGSGATLSATSGAATATGNTVAATFTYTATAGAASSAGTVALRFTYGPVSGSATATGGAVSVSGGVAPDTAPPRITISARPGLAVNPSGPAAVGIVTSARMAAIVTSTAGVPVKITVSARARVLA